MKTHHTDKLTMSGEEKEKEKVKMFSFVMYEKAVHEMIRIVLWLAKLCHVLFLSFVYFHS